MWNHHVLEVRLWGLLIWHYRVVEVACEEPRKHWGRKRNIESNVTT